MIKRNSIILLIRNYYIESEFLTYFDTGWSTQLFPSFTNEGQNKEELKEAIAKRFESPLCDVSLNYIGEFSETKPCREHNDEIREYHYEIYAVDLALGTMHQLPTFYWNGLKYKWESPKRLKKDNQVMKNNQALVNFVEQFEKKYWKERNKKK